MNKCLKCLFHRIFIILQLNFFYMIYKPKYDIILYANQLTITSIVSKHSKKKKYLKILVFVRYHNYDTEKVVN